MSRFRISFPSLIVALLAAATFAGGQTGIPAKRQVFGVACRLCPWGAMAEVVQATMKPYGYDVQICHNCNAADAPRIVSEARMPPPYRPDPAVPEILAPRNAPGLGPVDFGTVAIQFLRNAGSADGRNRAAGPLSGAGHTPMDDLMKRFDRFEAFGKELEITEFDINTSDEATQSDYTRDFMTAAFSLPSVKAFLMWGFWEGAHWIPRGAMMRRDWSFKPNGDVYKDLVFKRWWTNADGKTGAQGTFATRGSLGDYEIEVKAGGKVKTVRVSLPKEGAQAECVLE